MQVSVKQQVLDAFLLVMRPVVRILLRYGIGYREFAEVVKTAYVDISSSDFGIRGRPTNISRVAVMTGLTRKEVRRLRDKIAEGDTTISVKTTPLTDVLHHWHGDPDYTDSAGRPISLPFSGPDASFSDLVKKYGGDIPAGAMRTEMKRVGVVNEEEGGLLTVVGRGFKPESDHESLVVMLVHGVYALLSNVAHNSNPEETNTTWAHRIAYTKSMRSADRKQLRRITKDRVVDFAESIDDIFMAYESLQEEGDKDSKNDTVAVGIFYFEEQDENADYEW